MSGPTLQLEASEPAHCAILQTRLSEIIALYCNQYAQYMLNVY